MQPINYTLTNTKYMVLMIDLDLASVSSTESEEAKQCSDIALRKYYYIFHHC
jgi:hypothetical protein